MSYFERLRAASRERDSLLCVGLDPDPDRIPGGAAGALEFCRGLVARTADLACCFKPNSAFWEQYGPEGTAALAELIAGIPPDVPVILDAKRGDMGNTMRAYATAVFDAMGAGAATVAPYMGSDSIEEFTRHADRGVYVVCRSSNPGAADLQHLNAPDVPLYIRVARLARSLDRHGNVGLVVGATAPAEVAEVRAEVPSMPFLIPGVGAQGGDLEGSVRAAWNGEPASCLVAASRSVMYAADQAGAARDLRDAINAALKAVTR